ncbi:MAG: ligase-associated DNA damage response exonuclease [Bacteroidota bacterium]
MALLSFTERGIYCAQADVYIDPWRQVARAVITHGHSDHARWGMQHYLTHHDTVPIMQHRLGADISVQGASFGERLYMNGVEISLHPAGHIIGSAQVRLSYKGETWVVSGDYKVQQDGIATPFEAVKCNAFITESTFGLPIYRWQPQPKVMAEINDWWQQNASENRASLLIAYSLGKAQRVLENIDRSIGPVYTHGAVENMQEVLREHGIALQPTLRVTAEHKKADFRKALIVAPMGAIGSSWARKLEPYSLGIASGWMQLRGARRRRAADRGFVLSDHADWEGLNNAIAATEAEKVFVTHGYTEIFSKWLNEQGYEAGIVKTEFAVEEEE